jgi:quinolinate synthase
MDLISEINKLKNEKHAIILAHYYQPDEIQALADHIGDSYYLSKLAKDSSADTIIFCGVEFMAESAKLLSPEKKVMLAHQGSNCTMIDDYTTDDLLELTHQHPNAVVVSYINSSTEIKALSYACCTSASALNIVKNIKEKEIIFVPDKNLGGYIAEQCPDKKIITGKGMCQFHDHVTIADIQSLKSLHPDALVLTHPECRKEVRDLSDFIGSTGGILKYAQASASKEFIIVTEIGIRYALQLHCPDKSFYFPTIYCDGMKKTTLENIYDCLAYGHNEIILSKELSDKACQALDNMLLLAEKR